MSTYIERLIDERLRSELVTHSLVALVGPSGSGKLTQALRIAASADILDPLHEVSPGEGVRQGDVFLAGVRADPSVVYRGADPHLVADVHRMPSVAAGTRSYATALGEAKVRGALVATADCDVWRELSKADEGQESQETDGRRADGHELYADPTGAAGHLDSSSHATLRMLPLSLQELGVSLGEVSLEGLLEGELRGSRFLVAAEGDRGGVPVLATPTDLARAICRGGWPGCVGLSDSEALDLADHLGRLLIASCAGRARLSGEGVESCAWALARCVGGTATVAQIASGMEAMVGSRPARDTIRSYLRELEGQQVTLPVLGWTPPGRTRKRARSKARHYFVDPSIPAALLAKGIDALGEDPLLMLALTKNLLVRDLHVYLEATGGGRVCYYQDDAGREADFVVERVQGERVSWGAIRVVLTDATAEEAARELVKVARRSSAPPSFLAVISARGTKVIHLPSGVLVVPLSALGA